MAMSIDENHVLTVAARVKGWDLFSPRWSYINQHDTLSVRSLVALSLSINPIFADETWVFKTAIPYFEGQRDVDVDLPFKDDDEAACFDVSTELHIFIERLSVAFNGLNAGTLPMKFEGSAGPETTFAEFRLFAQRKQWELPVEFPGDRPTIDIAGTEQAREAQVPRRTAQVDVGRNAFETSAVNDKQAKSSSARWVLKKLKRPQGYGKPLHDFLNAANIAGSPCPKARDVLDAWGQRKPDAIQEVILDEIKYYANDGTLKTANLGAIRKTISRMVDE